MRLLAVLVAGVFVAIVLATNAKDLDQCVGFTLYMPFAGRRLATTDGARPRAPGPAWIRARTATPAATDR